MYSHPPALTSVASRLLLLAFNIQYFWESQHVQGRKYEPWRSASRTSGSLVDQSNDSSLFSETRNASFSGQPRWLALGCAKEGLSWHLRSILHEGGVVSYLGI